MQIVITHSRYYTLLRILHVCDCNEKRESLYMSLGNVPANQYVYNFETGKDRVLRYDKRCLVVTL